MSDGQRRGRVLLLVALLLLSLVLAGPMVASSQGSDRPSSGSAESFAKARAEGRAYTVSPHPNSTAAIWPYTSRSKSVEGATLPINIVVLADADLVRSMLVHRPDAQWEDQRHGLNGTAGTGNASETGEPNASEGDGGLTPDATATPSNSSVRAPTTTTNGTAVPPNASANGSTLTANGTLAANGTATPTSSGDGGVTMTPNATTSAPEGEGPLILSGINSTGVYWSDATGANRYTFVTNGEPGSGRWVDEADQLHDGDYFGARYHIRFYRVPDGENSWTALQVHREHFDWFRLRHTVGSLPTAQHYVETQFYNRWYVADLRKHRFSGGGILNYNGWATVVDLRVPEGLGGPMSVAALVFGLAVLGHVGRLGSPLGGRPIEEIVERSPITVRTLLAALAVAAIPLLVRVGSIAVEHSGLVNSPDVVAGAFYPIVALGPPAVAYVLFRGVEPGEAFVAAFVGLGVGFLADYAYLGIEVLPIQLIVHRVFLMIALGVVAVAGTDRPRGTRVDARDPALLAGGLLWVGGLLWTLFFW